MSELSAIVGSRDYRRVITSWIDELLGLGLLNTVLLNVDDEENKASHRQSAPRARRVYCT